MVVSLDEFKPSGNMNRSFKVIFHNVLFDIFISSIIMFYNRLKITIQLKFIKNGILW